MEINQTDNVITTTSILESGYSYIHVIQKITTETSSIFDSNITDSESEFTLTSDGYFILSEIKLPSTVDTNVNHYYITGNTVYNWEGEEVSISTLITIDTTGTNIIREDIDYLSKYYIYKYYIDILKNRFLKNICNCGNSGTSNCSSGVYNPTLINGVVDRGYKVSDPKQDKITIDTLTMGLEILDYLEEYLLYMEAQRIIEQLAPCGSITNTGCGCNG